MASCVECVKRADLDVFDVDSTRSKPVEARGLTSNHVDRRWLVRRDDDDQRGPRGVSINVVVSTSTAALMWPIHQRRFQKHRITRFTVSFTDDSANALQTTHVLEVRFICTDLRILTSSQVLYSMRDYSIRRTNGVILSVI